MQTKPFTKMKQSLLASLFLLFIINATFSQIVSSTEAKKIAIQVYSELCGHQDSRNTQNHKISEVIHDKHLGKPIFYAVNFQNGGFILIAAEKSAVPILGFSFQGSYNTKNQPAALTYLLDSYRKEIEFIREKPTKKSKKTEELWNMKVATKKGGSFNPIRSVEPLLTSLWNQTYPYNALCPEDENGPGGHTCAWCGAASTSQLMHYYKYPRQGCGSNSYTQAGYGIISADFGNTIYEWDAMPNKAEQPNLPIATLMHHIGVAADIEYGPQYSFGDIDSLRSALLRNFKYSPEIDLRIKYYYSDTAWQNMMMEQLDKAQPILYYGMGNGGHAWIIDGYLGPDYYHCNWNWSGIYDGYFYLNDLSPGPYNFSSGNGAIFNAFPNPDEYPYYCQSTDTLNYMRGQFGDGSGPLENYQNMQNCSWMLAPESPCGINNISIHFEHFNTDITDILRIYNGSDTLADLLGKFSGNSIPEDLTSTNDTVLIVFTSDNNDITEAGWLMNFEANERIHCQGTQTIYNDHGLLDDGSFTFDYNNNAACTWILAPENASFITATFIEFDTEKDHDFLNIYDVDQGNSLIGSYSGSELPEKIYAGSKLRLEFYTNGSITSTGWKMEFVADGHVSMDEAEAISTSIEPNPAKNSIRIRIKTPFVSETRLEIFNSKGQKVYAESVDPTAADFSKQLNINNWPTGVYFLHIVSGKLSIRRTFIKE